jgi:hypothetical protein
LLRINQVGGANRRRQWPRKIKTPPASSSSPHCRRGLRRRPLSIAIEAEIEAAETYERLAKLVQTSDATATLKEKAHFLRGEELKHRALLEEAYARQFPDVKAWYPRTILPTQSLAPRVDAAPVL